MTQRSSRAAGLLCLAVAAATGGCAGSNGDDGGSGLRAEFSPAPPAGGSDVIFLRERTSSGPLLALDVVGRNIAAPLDGMSLVMGFDPAIVEAFEALDTTFLGRCGRPRPDNTLLLCLENLSTGEASQTGVLLFSAYPQGGGAPETIAGDEVLATIAFRAVEAGSTSIDFYVAGRPAPGSASASEVTSAIDPNAAAAVAFVPSLPGQAFIEARRSR